MENGSFEVELRDFLSLVAATASKIRDVISLRHDYTMRRWNSSLCFGLLGKSLLV